MLDEKSNIISVQRPTTPKDSQLYISSGQRMSVIVFFL